MTKTQNNIKLYKKNTKYNKNNKKTKTQNGGSLMINPTEINKKITVGLQRLKKPISLNNTIKEIIKNPKLRKTEFYEDYTKHIDNNKKYEKYNENNINQINTNKVRNKYSLQIAKDIEERFKKPPYKYTFSQTKNLSTNSSNIGAMKFIELIKIKLRKKYENDIKKKEEELSEITKSMEKEITGLKLLKPEEIITMLDHNIIKKYFNPDEIKKSAIDAYSNLVNLSDLNPVKLSKHDKKTLDLLLVNPRFIGQYEKLIRISDNITTRFDIPEDYRITIIKKFFKNKVLNNIDDTYKYGNLDMHVEPKSNTKENVPERPQRPPRPLVFKNASSIIESSTNESSTNNIPIRPPRPQNYSKKLSSKRPIAT